MSKEFDVAVNALMHAGDALKSAGEAFISAGEAFKGIAKVVELRISKDESEVCEPAKEIKQEAPSKDIAKSITKAQVKELLVSKSRAGFTDQVKALLNKYGAANITGIKAEDLEAFYKEAEVIGNAG